MRGDAADQDSLGGILKGLFALGLTLLFLGGPVWYATQMYLGNEAVQHTKERNITVEFRQVSGRMGDCYIQTTEGDMVPIYESVKINRSFARCSDFRIGHRYELTYATNASLAGVYMGALSDNGPESYQVIRVREI